MNGCKFIISLFLAIQLFIQPIVACQNHDYKYDAEDNLYEVTENRGGNSRTYKREYDTRNRLTKTIDGANKSVAVTYDNANNLKTLTDASSRVTTYNYDQKNQLDTVKQGTATIADYDWYADGLQQKVTYQNSTTRNYAYDNANRVTNITNSFGAGQSESFDYGYDANSNRSSEIRKSNGQAFRTIAYTYDKVDRLTDADYTGNVQTPNPPNNAQAVYVENTNFNHYAYDAVGNRTSERNKSQSKTITLTTDNNGATTRTEQVSTSPETTTTATFDSLNQLTQLNEPNAVSNFSYDNNGNLSQVSKNASIISKYEYDIRNQLTKAKDGNNNELAKFDYDFERKRISKQGANGYESYVYAGNQIVNEYNAFGTATAKYTIGAGEVVKSEFAGGENNYHFTDALGSTTSLANNAGSLTNRNEYNAFGEQFTNANNVPTANSIGYTGQRLDNETGLMALGNGERYYSPSYARFIQQDSTTGSLNIPQSLNRFSYVRNNPNKYRDPSGNLPTAVAGAIIGGIFGFAIDAAHQAVDIYNGDQKDGFHLGQALWAGAKGAAIGFAIGSIVGGLALIGYGAAATVGFTTGGVVVGATSFAVNYRDGRTAHGLIDLGASLIPFASKGVRGSFGEFASGGYTGRGVAQFQENIGNFRANGGVSQFKQLFMGAKPEVVQESKTENFREPEQISETADYALDAKGEKVYPTGRDTVYHGTSEVTPEIALSEGLPARGTDLSLLNHVEAKGNSAFRGATKVVATPDGEGGAAVWAGKGGWVYKLSSAFWDVNNILEGRVETPTGFRGNRMFGEQELTIPAKILPEQIESYGQVSETSRGVPIVRKWIENPNYKPNLGEEK
jgi:RHS repeat-associated protein